MCTASKSFLRISVATASAIVNFMGRTASVQAPAIFCPSRKKPNEAETRGGSHMRRNRDTAARQK